MPQIPEDRLLSFAWHWRPGLLSLACIAGAEGCAGAAERASDPGGPATILCIALAASPSESLLSCTWIAGAEGRAGAAGHASDRGGPSTTLCIALSSESCLRRRSRRMCWRQPNMSQIAEDGPTCSCQLISTAWMVWPGQERADRAHGGSSNVAARSSLRFFLSCFIAGPAGCGGEHAAHGCSGEADPAG